VPDVVEERTGELPGAGGTGDSSTSTPETLEKDMAMGDDTKVILEQGFVFSHKRLEQTAERFNDGSGFVAQESKQTFLLREMLIGATAQNLLEKEGLADTLMQLKSAGTYPNNLGSGGGVVVTPSGTVP